MIIISLFFLISWKKKMSNIFLKTKHDLDLIDFNDVLKTIYYLKVEN